ncbi:phosphotransferase [Streptomyces sp. NRRL F-525]|uniref:phosphotransferase n=1 Tax=Streptomyces sp. NRRL F-525 TaxID=1463861 RepID=UPI002D218CFB|nr:phosphotransferase [Streptomyces sp. NRRL F-525]
MDDRRRRRPSARRRRGGLGRGDRRHPQAAPRYEGRFLHRDFHPGNVLFDVPSRNGAGLGISGVVDWVQTSWGPADLDVAHCSTNLALLHGPAWGLRFPEAYEEAGGVLAAAAGGCTGGCWTRWRSGPVWGRWLSRGGRRGWAS